MTRTKAKRIRGKLAYPCKHCTRLSVHLVDRRHKESLCRRCFRKLRNALTRSVVGLIAGDARCEHCGRSYTRDFFRNWNTDQETVDLAACGCVVCRACVERESPCPRQHRPD
ncbi:MAG: hypothetical protein KY476_00580 [Planctomycetes bacterium]|nr:hypothetical protein [Planctomycetota bacterium]